jgi:hypothetical protein
MRNGLTIAIGISFFALISTCRCHAQSGLPRTISGKSSPAMKLAASVDSIKYCEGDDDVYTAHLQLRFQYTNLSSGNTILYKTKTPIEITSAIIGRSVNDLEGRQFETTIQYDQFVEPQDIPSESLEPDQTQFVVVYPNKSSELAGEVAVAVRRRPNKSLPGTIASGNHVMIVDVVDWPFTLDAGQRLQRRWAKVGVLSYAAMESEPFEFSIASAPSLQECSKQTQHPPASGRSLRTQARILWESPR